MAHGPGKYDDEALELLLRMNAGAVLLCVLDGPKGNGSSMKLCADFLPQAPLLAVFLREMADNLEQDVALLLATPRARP
jgi:hypothetical protein